MGMTDKQFDSYKARELRLLERIKEEISGKTVSPTLDTWIADLQSELRKP